MIDIERLNAWLKVNGFWASAEFSDDDGFWYDSEEDLVLIGKVKDDERLWLQFMSDIGLINMSIPVIVQAFCHELGHSETLDRASDEDWSEYETLRIFWDNNSNDEKQQLAYYNTAIERMASDWAVWFMNFCPDKIAELTDILCKA